MSKKHIRIGVMVMLSTSLFLWCSLIQAAQARALLWKYSYVTEQCKDPDGDGKKMHDLEVEDAGGDWLDVMKSHWSVWTLDYTIYANEITDFDDCTWGRDHRNGNLDDGDGNLLMTHSIALPLGNPTYWRVRLSSNSGNGGSTPCASKSTNMTLGDNDAEFIHTTGCHSAEWRLIRRGYNAMDGRLHQFGGFHGEFWTSGDRYLDDFAEEGFVTASGLSWAWIENMTVWDIHGSADNCAVSLVQGFSRNSAIYRQNHEDYNAVQYTDPHGQWVKFHYYCNCNPSGTGSGALHCD